MSKAVRIGSNQYDALMKFQQITGTSVESAVKEALDDYIEAVVSSRIEETTGTAGQA